MHPSDQHRFVAAYFTSQSSKADAHFDKVTTSPGRCHRHATPSWTPLWDTCTQRRRPRCVLAESRRPMSQACLLRGLNPRHHTWMNMQNWLAITPNYWASQTESKLQSKLWDYDIEMANAWNRGKWNVTLIVYWVPISKFIMRVLPRWAANGCDNKFLTFVFILFLF
jgi:hypothetical protein